MKVFETLDLWIDPVARTGPGAMAVDEWLMTTRTAPVLRVYRWKGNWGSLGYFGRLDDARQAIPEVSWVRRWTGGGIVDHRADWTYTLFAPAGEPWVARKGGTRYRAIHSALAETLRKEGTAARLSSGDDATGATVCFENPVDHDLVGASGRKLAGAGQRRNLHGLLHQGSVALPCGEEQSHERSWRLANALGAKVSGVEITVPEDAVTAIVRDRYGRPEWTSRR